MVLPTSYEDRRYNIFEEVSGNVALRTTATISGDVLIGAVEIKDADTDVRVDVKDDGTNSAMFVQANSLDIRPIASGSDSINVGAISDTVNVLQTADVNVTATDLDIRDLTSASDSVTVTGNVYIFNKLVPEVFDYVGVSYPDASSEAYDFKTGGSGGSTVATVSLAYLTSAKTDLASVTRT